MSGHSKRPVRTREGLDGELGLQLMRASGLWNKKRQRVNGSGAGKRGWAGERSLRQVWQLRWC